ncbi:hypothetical protein SBV1_1530036 [Verrucomicrobia bacterium]|nr:hypothetical protein SBV1_1530036 [Verrucomicrobiota bacterium]
MKTTVPSLSPRSSTLDIITARRLVQLVARIDWTLFSFRTAYYPDAKLFQIGELPHGSSQDTPRRLSSLMCVNEHGKGCAIGAMQRNYWIAPSSRENLPPV